MVYTNVWWISTFCDIHWIKMDAKTFFGYQISIFFKFKNLDIKVGYHFILFSLDINVLNINHYLSVEYHYWISYTPIAHIL